MRVDTTLFAQKNIELAKDPRYVIELSFDTANTQLWYFTSHSDSALPPTGVAGSILGVIEGLSGTSQTLSPDTANASIGSISFSLVDRLSIVTTTLGGQLVLGRSTRKQRVRIYVGFQGLAWADYTLVQTQLVTEIAFAEGAYKFKCADIQREMRKDLFDQAKTNLALSLSDSATTVDVVTITGFSMVAHGTSYSDAPSATVGYIEIEDEVIRYTGKTSTQFTGCTRGALNTRAVAHNVDSTAAQDRNPAVTEYIYLELPAIDLIYRLLTGKDRNGASVLPSTWNLGIATSYVRLADFTGIGKDLWDTSDDQQGFVVRLEDLKKTDGKKFIETELALLCGVFMPIYADGALGCKRMANILAGAAYTAMLDERNVVSYGDLVHDFGSLHNLFDIAWNWEPLQQDFTRHEALLDAGSIDVHNRADPLRLTFRGLHGSRHSAAIIRQRFNALRDRYTGPPLRLDVSVVPSLNTLEVGDVVRVRLANVRDFNPPSIGALDRSFEIQNIQTDWITGNLQLKLFASSQAPGAIAETSDATVLTAGWYTGTGTALTSVLTITGSNPGHITVGGNLTGHADLGNAGAVYYYTGDLQIDADVLSTINNNVWLRVNGFLQINGKIDGKGRGLPGAATGTAGFIGATEAGGGLVVQPPVFGTVVSNRGQTVAGLNANFPMLNLDWDGAVLSGVPSDLRGTSGSAGNPVTGRFGSRVAGGTGGAGGAGLVISCKGLAFGAAGSVDLSGVDGTVGGDLTDSGAVFHAGSGAGGAGGGLLILLDGAGTTATGLTDAGFVCLNGKTPIRGGQRNATSDVLAAENYSYFPGTGDGTTFPLPSLSDSRGGSRVQYVPGNPLATVDPLIPDLELVLQEMQASNWTERTNPKALQLRSVVWSGSIFTAVGLADATDAYIVTSSEGTIWTEQANPKALALRSIAWNGSLFVAVGDTDATDAYIITSSDAITWTERANPKALSLRSVAWNGSLFVAVGVTDATDAYIITSTDAITWNERANPKNVSLLGVAWNGSLFVAVGNGDGTNAYIVTSPDGTTWTQRTNPKNTQLNAVAIIRGVTVAAGSYDGSVDAYIVTSPDAINWTERANPAKHNISGIASTGDLLVSCSFSAGVGDQFFMTSRDLGANWIARETVRIVDSFGIFWSGHRFVSVGSADAVDAQILTSLAR